MRKQEIVGIICFIVVAVIVLCYACTGLKCKEKSFVVIEKIYSVQNANQDIEITYPQVECFNNDKKVKILNALIEDDVKKILAESDVYDDFFQLKLDYQLKMINEHIISIFYTGMYGNAGSGHGLSAIAMATTIDIESEKVIALKDVINIEELGVMLLADEFENITIWDGVKGTGLISREYAGRESKLIEYLGNTTFDLANHYVEWYVDGESFVFVSLYGADYEEYSIDLERVKHILTENGRKYLKVLY